LKKAVDAKDWKTVRELARRIWKLFSWSDLAEEMRKVVEPLDENPEANRYFEEVSREEERKQTEAWLARMAWHLPSALLALRTRIPATEVPDSDVTVVFWDKADGFVAAGYWLGKDRAVAFGWDQKAGQVIEDSERELAFYDLKARTDVEKRIFELMREQARYLHRPVVPIRLAHEEGGRWKVVSYDGWEGCGHWSEGDQGVDLDSGKVEGGGHTD